MYRKIFPIALLILLGCAPHQRMVIVTPPGEQAVPLCPDVGRTKSALDPDVVTFTSRGPDDRSLTRTIYLVQGRYSQRELFVPRADGRWQRQVRPLCQFSIRHGSFGYTRSVARHVSQLLVDEDYTAWIVDTKDGGLIGQYRRSFRVRDDIRGERINLTGFGEQLVHQEVRLPRARAPDLVRPSVGMRICFGCDG